MSQFGEEALMETLACLPDPQDCACIDEVNTAMHEKGYNAAILTNLFGAKRATIETYKVLQGKRGAKPPIVMATYCPFCGVKYPVRAARAPRPVAS